MARPGPSPPACHGDWGARLARPGCVCCVSHRARSLRVRVCACVYVCSVCTYVGVAVCRVLTCEPRCSPCSRRPRRPPRLPLLLSARPRASLSEAPCPGKAGFPCWGPTAFAPPGRRDLVRPGEPPEFIFQPASRCLHQSPKFFVPRRILGSSRGCGPRKASHSTRACICLWDSPDRVQKGAACARPLGCWHAHLRPVLGGLEAGRVQGGWGL